MMTQTLDRYEEKLMGLPYPVVLLDAAEEVTHPKTGKVLRITIPEAEEMAAAVALALCFIPTRLTGAEVRFIRRVLDMTGKDSRLGRGDGPCHALALGARQAGGRRLGGQSRPHGGRPSAPRSRTWIESASRGRCHPSLRSARSGVASADRGTAHAAFYAKPYRIPRARVGCEARGVRRQDFARPAACGSQKAATKADPTPRRRLSLNEP